MGESSITHPHQTQDLVKPEAEVREEDAASVFSNSVDRLLALEGDARKHKQPVQEEIAAKENRWVFRLRTATFCFLLLAAIGVALVTFFYVRTAEETQMEEKFHDNAHKVQEAIGTLLENTLKAVDSFTVAMTSYAASTVGETSGQSNTTAWPYVTLPNYAVQGSKLRSLSKVFLFSAYHRVEHAQRDAWENYSRTHDDWVDAGIESQKTDPSFKGMIVEEWQTLGQINFNGQRAPDADFYMARWQTSPVVPFWDPYNWDPFQLPLIRAPMQNVLDTRKVVISETYNMGEKDTVDLTPFVGDSATAFEPAVELYTPVIDDTSGSVSLVDKANTSKVVAIMGLSIHWRSLIEDSLPLGNDGMVVVFQSECNQTFTYEIDGPKVVYLGEGDQSDPDYHYLSQNSSFADLTTGLNAGDSSYTGPTLSEDFCPYSITIYPSKIMAEEYLSSDPYRYAFGAVLIFVFTSLVFLAYDCMIEKRQRIVMTTAKQSTRIVDSLFPSNVKKRLYQQEIEESHDVSESQSSENILRAFLSGGQDLPDRRRNSSEPIADQFDETTVLFADIKGFTKWSSTRSPSQVFRLLETLYGAFDTVAEKRGVYKIETIGDSYVAVCGLPEPRKDHALVMAKFAADVRSKTNKLAQELRETLGDGTEELQMRIGLHSGAVTAGVLRGDRARFQLFGDTVNTAARMESNGQGNAIQCSQATADLIIMAQKGHWLTKRKDLVQAKGKGYMQTYWVEPYSNATPSVSEVSLSIETPSRVDSSLLGPMATSQDSPPRGSRSMIYPEMLRN